MIRSDYIPLKIDRARFRGDAVPPSANRPRLPIPSVSGNRRIQMFFPKAESVFAIGEFNHWSTVATPLARIEDQVDEWEFQLPSEVKVKQLDFFVIFQGARFGRLVHRKNPSRS